MRVDPATVLPQEGEDKNSYLQKLDGALAKMSYPGSDEEKLTKALVVASKAVAVVWNKTDMPNPFTATASDNPQTAKEHMETGAILMADSIKKAATALGHDLSGSELQKKSGDRMAALRPGVTNRRQHAADAKALEKLAKRAANGHVDRHLNDVKNTFQHIVSKELRKLDLPGDLPDGMAKEVDNLHKHAFEPLMKQLYAGR